MNFLFRLKLTLLTTLVVCLAGVVRPQYPRPPPPHADHRYGPPPPPPHHHHPYHGQEEEHHEAQCALVVPGLPGKSAAGDRYANLKYVPDETCITYEAVDAAFSAAKSKLRLPSTKSRTLTERDIDLLGKVIVETTRNLANQYGLPADVISNGLPLIDTSKTAIDQFCPSFLKKEESKCTAERYRQYNGLCNNLEHPYWGAALTAFRRMIPADYADGISKPRISANGKDLPTTRHISAVHHHDMGYHDHAVTVFLISWGQAIDHDMTFTADTKDPVTDTDPLCCDVPENKRNEECYPVEIPAKDPFYALFRRRCMEFVRSASSLKGECKLGPRSHLNLISSVIDANFIYGSDKETADGLRTLKGGLLKSTPMFREHGLKDLLPLKLENPDDGCIRATPDTYCFMAGDPRVNEQLVLSVTHTLLMREHNRIAQELSVINPHWDDEIIYQETRHIMAALIQQITYNEFLPMVLGKDLMESNKLILERDGYWNGYNDQVDPSLPASFGAAAFRFGHSLLPSAVERWSTTHKYIGAQRLSQMLRQPYDLYKGGYCDQYVSGLMNQVSQAMDGSMSQEVTNHLFQDSGKNWGLDLAALNMQRGRDHGIPSYNAFREHCGLKRANSWRDLSDAFTNDTLKHFTSIYDSPDDIDLWTAGVSERALTGSMVGPVFGCIIGQSFRDLRAGDRFWHENPKQPSSFTLEQLQEIRKVRLARIVCDNSDDIESAQVYVMVLPDPEINPRVSCKSSVLPRMDLSKWKDKETKYPAAAQPPAGRPHHHHRPDYNRRPPPPPPGHHLGYRPYESDP
ncbi:Chorion peroxidase [Daphnia magna]|uniref:Chorion peroxidase n=1 Tax=Daphnia magna TaxID=35525 RepID=A0A162EDD3_9CRUS|nr:Chorion peroxidase [Daphnia magna]